MAVRSSRRRRTLSSSSRGIFRRIVGLVARAILAFIIGSIALVIVYRFVAPPITLTMIGDLAGGRSITKTWRPLDRIDRTMARAAIAAEDSKFCSHHGFDAQAIEAAMKRNAAVQSKGRGRIRGGSTISQQTAKNTFLWQGGGYVRKGLEAWFTALIEGIWGKRRIMEVYLNIAETGIATYGVEAASQRYFRHGADHMTTSEAARLAAVLPLPKKREATIPRGYTRRYGRAVAARVGVVRRDRLDGCLG